MLHAAAALTAPPLPPGPTPKITWLGTPPLGGQSGDFELYATRTGLFVEALATGFEADADVRVRYRALPDGDWVTAPYLTVRDDDQPSQYLQTMMGHRRGTVLPATQYQVEMVEAALIGTAAEAGNTRRKTATTWDRDFDQFPFDVDQIIYCPSPQAFINVWNSLTPGDQNVVIAWDWDGIAYMPVGQSLNALNGVNNVAVWSPRGWGTTLSAATDDVSPLWIEDVATGPDLWYTEAFPVPDANQYMWVSVPGGPITLASALPHYDRDGLVPGSGLQINLCGWHMDRDRGRTYVKVVLRDGVTRADPNQLHIVGSTHPVGFNIRNCDRFALIGTHWDGFSAITSGVHDQPKPRGAGFVQDCTNLLVNHVKTSRNSRDIQLNGNNDGLLGYRFVSDYDTTYTNSQSIKATNTSGDPPYFRPYPMEELGMGLWQQGPHQTRGLELEEFYMGSGAEGVSLQDVGDTGQRPADRRQHAYLIRGLRQFNNFDGLNFDGANSNKMVCECVVHGRGPVISMAPLFYGRIDFVDCQLQGGWIPGMDGIRQEKEIIHYTFAGATKNLGVNHFWFCTLRGHTEGLMEAYTIANQDTNPPFSGSHMGNHHLWQFQEEYPTSRQQMRNCIVEQKSFPPGGVNPRGWFLTFQGVGGGIFGNPLSSDFSGLLLDNSVVHVLASAQRSNATVDGVDQSVNEFTIAGFKQRYPDFPGLIGDQISEVDPQLDDRHLPAAPEAVEVFEPIVGLEGFTRAGAVTPFEYIPPTDDQLRADMAQAAADAGFPWPGTTGGNGGGQGGIQPCYRRPRLPWEGC